MKKLGTIFISIIIIIFTLQISLKSQDISKPNQHKLLLNTDLKQISYVLGYHLGTELAKKKEKVVLDTLVFLEGIKEAMAKQTPLIPDSTMEKIFKAFSDTLIARNARKAQAIADSNKKVGEAFLAENQKKEGVVTLPDGMQYKIIKEGNGISPRSFDTCVVHYRGMFLDGKEFDNSYKNNLPWKLSLDWATKGLKEAVPMMKVGSKWMLWIPSSLGYGDRGYKNLIPGGSLVVFELELLEVIKGPEHASEKKNSHQK